MNHVHDLVVVLGEEEAHRLGEAAPQVQGILSHLPPNPSPAGPSQPLFPTRADEGSVSSCAKAVGIGNDVGQQFPVRAKEKEP